MCYKTEHMNYCDDCNHDGRSWWVYHHRPGAKLPCDIYVDDERPIFVPYICSACQLIRDRADEKKRREKINKRFSGSGMAK